MSLGRGLIVRDGRPIISQFLFRPLIECFDAGPLANPGPTVMYPGYLGDVCILYLCLLQRSGGVRNIGLRADLDGTTIEISRGGALADLADNTIYYAYINSETYTGVNNDFHLYTVDRTLYGGDESVYAQSFGNITVQVNQADVDNMYVWIRYVQL